MRRGGAGQYSESQRGGEHPCAYLLWAQLSVGRSRERGSPPLPPSPTRRCAVFIFATFWQECEKQRDSACKYRQVGGRAPTLLNKAVHLPMYLLRYIFTVVSSHSGHCRPHYHAFSHDLQLGAVLFVPVKRHDSSTLCSCVVIEIEQLFLRKLFKIISIEPSLQLVPFIGQRVLI